MAALDLTTPFLHQVKEPRGNHKLDIVFVHGVNPTGAATHPYDTWTHAQSRVCWPRDLLGDDIPSARIFVYGYNSNVRNAELMSEARITHHASNLLMLLSDERDATQSSTRIVFIGHSLGGLVIKQALLNAQRDRSYTSILTATYGLAFFAVPHRGGNGVPLGKIVAGLTKFISNGRADNEILDSLEKNSLFTQEMSDQFRHQLEDYQVVSFFEQRKTHITGKSMASVDMTIVGEQSAVLQLPGTRERQVPVTDADHSTICKIKERGNLYQTVLKSLTRHITDKAIDSVHSFIPPPSFGPSPSFTPPVGATSASSSRSIAQNKPPSVVGSLYTPASSSPRDVEVAKHKNMGRWLQAIPLLHEIFQDWQRTAGQNHLSTLEATYDLAHAYCQMADPKRAIPWIDWLLQTTTSTLGQDHQLTLKTESLSAEAMSLEGDKARAEEVCVRVSLRQEELFGPDHVDTLATQERLARICIDVDRKEEGKERLRKHAVAIERIFGETHMKAHQASLLFCEQTYPANIEPYHISQVPEQTKSAVAQLHQDLSNAFSRRHPLALYCLRLIGTWQFTEGKFVDALDTLRRALNDCQDLGADHPETVNVEIMIGCLYYKQSSWKDAIPRFQKYSDWLVERGRGSERESTTVLSMLGNMYMINQEWAKVETVYKQLRAAAAGRDEVKVQEAEQGLQRIQPLLQIQSMTSSGFGYGGSGSKSRSEGLLGAIARYGLR